MIRPADFLIAGTSIFAAIIHNHLPVSIYHSTIYHNSGTSSFFINKTCRMRCAVRLVTVVDACAAGIQGGQKYKFLHVQSFTGVLRITG